MATASVTYTFVTSTTAFAPEVNTNFNNLVTFLNNSTIHKDGTIAFTGNVDAGSNKVVNVATPTAGNDAVNKTYADALTAAGSITTAKLADDAVTDAKMGAPTTGSLDGGRLQYARYGNLVAVWTQLPLLATTITLPVGFRPVGSVTFISHDTGTGVTAERVIQTSGLITGNTADDVFSVVFTV